jgi:hypothetical protein
MKKKKTKSRVWGFEEEKRIESRRKWNWRGRGREIWRCLDGEERKIIKIKNKK